MEKLQFLVTHCSDTPPEMPVLPGDLYEWHKGPKDLEGERVKYLGKIYKSRKDLPDHTLNNKPIAEVQGRGWDRLGYSDMITRNGELINITPYNDDQIVQANEMTWGAAGINSKSRHVMLAGGWYNGERSIIKNFFDIFSEQQFVTYVSYLKQFQHDYPEAKITGHNDHTNKKTCPNFDVEEFINYIKL